MHLTTESYPSDSYEVYGTDTDGFEFKSKEKESYKEETKVSVKEDGHKEHCEKKAVKTEKKEKKSRCSNTGFGIILFVIFIIILFIVIGGLWYVQPDCVCGGSGSDREFSLASAGLYAFIIALFFILIIGAAWWACS